jgi:hypothetical protein
MPLLNAPQLAASLKPPITKQRIYQLRDSGHLVLTGKKFDTDHPINASWLAGYPYAVQPKPASTRHCTTATPGVTIVPPPESEGGDAEELLEQVANLDFAKLTKAQIDKIKSLESALKIRVERQHKRRELIERSLVQAVFGRLYQLDANQWKTLSAKLAPTVAGVAGVDDPEKILAIEQCIDDEVCKVLAHLKRLLNDALVGWGAVGVS